MTLVNLSLQFLVETRGQTQQVDLESTMEHKILLNTQFKTEMEIHRLHKESYSIRFPTYKVTIEEWYQLKISSIQEYQEMKRYLNHN